MSLFKRTLVLIYSRYLKTSLRFLFKNKLYTLLNMAGLATAFAVVILIGLYLIHEFSTDKHFSHYENLYRLNRGDDSGLAIPLLEPLSSEFTEFEQICRLQPIGSAILGVDRNNVRAGQAFFADTTVFDLFDIELSSGTVQNFNSPTTIFLSESLAEILFDSINPIGRVVKYEGLTDMTIKGVYPDLSSNSHIQMDFLIPINNMSALSENNKTQYETLQQWGSNYYLLMNNPSLVDSLDARLNRFIKQVTKNENWQMHIQSFGSIYFDSQDIADEGKHGDRRQLQVLFLVALGIVIIGCINYFNLTTATSFARTREIAIKKALGVSKNKLFTQFIVETLLLVVVSALAGFILAEMMVPYLNNLYSLELEVKILYSFRYLIWVILIVLGFGALAGLYPAHFMSKMSVLRLFQKPILHRKGGNPVRIILIVFQYAVTTILFISVFTINAQVKYLVNLDPGFEKEQLIYLSYGEEAAQSFEGFKSDLLLNPSILGLSQTANIPGQGYWQNMVDMNGERLIFFDCIADPSYAEVLGIQVKEGEFINEGSAFNQQLVLNERAVELLGLEDPIGYTEVWGIPVVGVVKDFNYQSMHNEIKPLMIRYSNYFQYALIKISSGQIAQGLTHITETWEKHFPNQPIEYHFFDKEFESLYYSEIRFGKLITAFSVIAMLISCFGLFGLTSFIAKKSSKDSGIKSIFGASGLQLFGFYLFRFIKWQGIALAIGVPASWFIMNHWLEKFAYRCSIPMFGVVLTIVIILVISILTVLYHAVKITRQNPVDSIRNE